MEQIDLTEELRRMSDIYDAPSEKFVFRVGRLEKYLNDIIVQLNELSVRVVNLEQAIELQERDSKRLRESSTDRVMRHCERAQGAK